MRRTRMAAAVAAVLVTAAAADTAQATIRLEQQSFETHDWPTRQLAVGDYDADGIADVANGREVLFGKGGGRFAPPTIWQTGHTFMGITPIDWSGDGITDILTAETVAEPSNPTCRIEAWSGDGAGEFSTTGPSTWTWPGAVCGNVEAGDFDSDGWRDFAVLDTQGDTILGNRPARYAAPGDPSELAMADVNGDGHFDMVVLASDGTVRVNRGTGPGTFAATWTTYPAGAGALDLAVADVEGDGKADIATIGTSTVQVRFGSGPVRSFPETGGKSVELADLDGDGRRELLVTRQRALVVRESTGPTTFGAAQRFAGAYDPGAIEAVDEDGVGGADYLALRNGSGNILIYRNRSVAAGTASPATQAFGSLAAGAESAPQAVTLANTGHHPLKVSEVRLVGAYADEFAVTSDACDGTTLQRGQQCEVSVRFRPRGAGEKTAQVRFAHDAGSGHSSATVTGTGTEPVGTQTHASSGSSTAAAPPASAVPVIVVNAPAGSRGEKGEEGDPGRDGIVRCEGRTCRLTLDPTRSVQRVTASLRRGGRTLARAAGLTGARTARMRLRSSRRLAPGTYVLRIVRVTKSGRRVVDSRRIRIGR